MSALDSEWGSLPDAFVARLLDRPAVVLGRGGSPDGAAAALDRLAADHASVRADHLSPEEVVTRVAFFLTEREHRDPMANCEPLDELEDHRDQVLSTSVDAARHDEEHMHLP